MPSFFASVWLSAHKRIIVLCSALLVMGACGAAPTGEVPPGLRLLFIGNSLTYVNNVPGMVELMLRTSGEEVSDVQSIAHPNYALVDHWEDGAVQDVIRDGQWDFVIMQQGPSATEGRPWLLDYTELFHGEIEPTGAVTALYMVWPSLSRFFDFNGVLASYKDAADLVGGLFLPAGEAWRTAWAADSTLQLYGGDNFHPTELGSYLAALVIFESVTGTDARTLPARMEYSGLNTLDIPAATAGLLQAAAHETVLAFAAP